MAFTPSQFLRERSSEVLRDPQHAARLFTDDQFRLAPKHKFLFHVSFGINQSALQNVDLLQRHRNEINMLVKSCDLPSFSISTETLIQYNRKKIIQNTHKFNPINMTFHDDNMGLINQLWQNYYNYYYADASSAADTTGAYNRNATKNFSTVINTYGLDNNSNNPFFTYITIYQMARHEYVSYTLHNPVITSWNHNKVDYAQNAIHDNTMQLAYEAVSYGRGMVSEMSEGGVPTLTGDVEGFGVEHYDTKPSPLQGGDPRNSASPTFTNNGNISNNASGFISNLVTTINSYQNTKELPLAAPSGTIANVIETATPGVSGVQGIAFPVSTANTTTPVATQVNLG